MHQVRRIYMVNKLQVEILAPMKKEYWIASENMFLQTGTVTIKL